MNKKKIIISQPRYLPSLNYLQRLYFADLFIFLDNVQRQGRDYENRNKLLIGGETNWLTIPISSSSRELIKNTKVAGREWVRSHKNIIINAYKLHPYYSEALVEQYYSGVENILGIVNYDFSEVVICMLLNICSIFGFIPHYKKASSYPETDIKKGPDKLVEICKQAGANIYVSGPNGKEYGVTDAFASSGIMVAVHDFEYPSYKQFNQNSFVPWLAFFDALFNVGVEEMGKWILKKPNLVLQSNKNYSIKEGKHTYGI